MADANPYRLPRTVVPERYELTLTPDLDESRFTGEAQIRVTAHEAVQQIQLNAAELDVLTAELIGDDGTKVDAAVSLDEDAEVATIALSREVAPGDWTLHLTFAGTLNDKLRGFYRSTFTDDQGVERVIATTQFEATDARRAFPCWDEPDLKSVFAVRLIVDEELAAFSNAAVQSETSLGTGKRLVVFNDSMKMSTYLVAFVVGPLVVTEPVDVDGTPLRVACVPGRQALGAFALEAGAAALRLFAEYFKIPYPGDKVDMIALPDFAFGAMENLGCITFRETALLVDTERASRLEIERVADVVAHEIAHMWFGDLVTMKWWNGIWLNEAFATFMELFFVDRFRPEWEKWVSFGLSKSAAMAVDGLAATRPIEYPVIRPEEAQGMFDLLTYEKGASVLRMLEQHLGAHEFSVGISAYLHDHSYGNAETTDLWDALESTSNEPVRALMDSWIFQGGHPIVHVARSGDGGLTLKQRRFRYLAGSEDEAARWHIPIGVRAMIDNTMHAEKLLLTEGSATLALPGPADWVVVNERAHGFYRVSYDPGLLRDLVENVHALDALERFTLASDTWAACLAGSVDLADVLGLIEKLKGDDDPNVWGAVLAPLRMLDKVVDGPARSALQQRVRDLVRPGHDWLGWEPHHGESERLATLRGVFIGALGVLGADEGVRREALARYALYQSETTALDANLVSPVEGVISSMNEAANYDRLHAKFSSESSTPQEKVNALGALAAFTAPALLERTLAMIEAGDVRTQDAPYALRSMLAQRDSGKRVWEWSEEHWSTLMDRFPDNSIARMVEGVAAQVDTGLATRVQNFLAANPVPQAQKLIEQTCERLAVNVAFADRNRATATGLLTQP